MSEFHSKSPISLITFFLTSIFDYIFHYKFFLFSYKTYLFLLLFMLLFHIFYTAVFLFTVANFFVCLHFDCKFILSGLFLWNFLLTWDEGASLFRGDIFFLPQMYSTLFHAGLFCPFFPFHCICLLLCIYILFAFGSTYVHFSACSSINHRSSVNLNSKPMWLHTLSGDLVIHRLPTESARTNKPLCLLPLFTRNFSWWLFFGFFCFIFSIYWFTNILDLLILNFVQELCFQPPFPFLGLRPGLLGKLPGFLESSTVELQISVLFPNQFSNSLFFLNGLLCFIHIEMCIIVKLFKVCILHDCQKYKS